MSRALVLVPTSRHVEAALRRADAREPSARTLRALRDDAADALLGDARLADAATSRLAVSRAIDALADRGDVRAPTSPAARARLAQSFDVAIGRLRAAGTPTSALASARPRRARELGRVMAHVDAAFAAAGLVDPRTVGARVAARVAVDPVACDALVPDGVGEIVVRGFAALDGDARALLEAAHAVLRARGGRGVRVELPRFDDASAASVDDGALARDELDAESRDPMSALADALEAAWSSLDDAPEIGWTRPPAPARLEVVSARDEAGEARAAVRAVLDALAAGTPPERIAIAAPSMGEAELEPLVAALDEARVPFREARGRSAASSPEGRAVRALLSLAAGPMTRDDVLELLRAPGLAASVLGEARESTRDRGAQRAIALAHRLREVPISIDRDGRFLAAALREAIASRSKEGRSRVEAPRRGRRGAPAGSMTLGEATASAETASVDAWMPAALERLLDLPRYIADAHTRVEVGARLLATLARLGIGRPDARALREALDAAIAAAPRARTVIDGEASAAATRALGASARALRAIEAEVRAWISASVQLGVGDEPVTTARVAAEIELALRGAATAPAGSAAEAAAVRVARVADLAALDHDLLVVVGLVEGADDAQDDGLVDDAVRRELPAGLAPPRRAERAAARRAELTWALSGAARAVLTHATGTDAEPAPPHAVVRAALAAGAPRRFEPLSRVASGASILDARGAELARLAAGARPAADVAGRSDAERARAAFFLDPRAPSDRFTGRFAWSDADRAHAAAAVGGDAPARALPVTSVERAAQCAFLSFASRVLKARRREESSEAADPRERGNLIHRALEVGFEAAFGGTASTDDDRLALARSAAAAALGLATARAPLRRASIAAAIDDAMAALAEALASGDSIRFALAERPFGPGAAWPALELAGDGPGVHVEGRIDRVDVDASGKRARVVDYKSGSSHPAIADHGVTAFQLPLYAAVVERALGGASVEGAYVLVKQRGAAESWPKRPADRERVAAHAAEVLERARQAVVDAWGGDGGARPVRASVCATCEARDVCRRPAVAPDSEADDG